MVLLIDRRPRSCPVCGAADMACRPGEASGGTPIERDTDYEVRSDGTVILDARHRYRLPEGRWRSTREVLVEIGKHKHERRYAEGDLVPLLVALGQGTVRRAQLVEADKEELKRHLRDGRITLDELREALVQGGA